MMTDGHLTQNLEYVKMIRKKKIMMAIFISIYIPILLSYVSQGGFYWYCRVILPFLLILMFSKYLFIQAEIKLYTNLVILGLYFIISISIIILFNNDGTKGILHFISYFIFILSVLGFSQYLLYSKDDRSESFYLLFKYIFITYVSLVISHHLLIFIGSEYGIYFWNFNFIDKRRISTATFSGIGNGKNITAQLTTLAIISSLLIFNNRKLLKFVSVVILSSLGLIIFSRAFLISLLIIFVIKIINRKNFIAIFLSLVIIIVILENGINYFQIQNLIIRDNISNIETFKRYQLLMAHINIIKDHPLVGVGWENLRYNIINIQGSKNVSEIGLISFISEQGLIRSLLLLSFVFKSFYVSVITSLKSNNYIYVLSSISVITILGYALIWGNIMVSGPTSFIFWLLIFISQEKLNE